MGFQVSIAKAKAAFASLIARAEAGEEVIVTRHGRPVARIVPMPKQSPIKYGDLVIPGDTTDYSFQNLEPSDAEIDEIEREIIADDELYRKGNTQPLKDK